MPHFYHLTLQRPTAVVQAINGNFSAPRAQEIVVARGTLIELLRPDDQGKVHSIASTEIYGFIRCIAPFRLTGGERDNVVVGSDSGRLVVLEFNAQKNCFEKVHQETFGRSGVRRIVPGQYLATDPRGRAIMVGAVERSKFVYVMNRDAAARLTISSPLEAHKSHHICFALTAVDVGFENPIFASLEQNYEEADRQRAKAPPRQEGDAEDFLMMDTAMNAQLPPYTPPRKTLAFWEMDLGLNHVIKKCALPVPLSAHSVLPVPAGSGSYDGPSGVIVCCENYLIYMKPEHPEIKCAIPRRLEMGHEKTLLIVSWAVHRTRGFFFFLLQSDYGDLYKVELTHAEGVVSEMVCRYFDSIPVGNSLCVLRSGFLFLASEFGNHQLYQFTGIGSEETNAVICSSQHPHQEGAIVAFKPRPLTNLALVDDIPSLCPITDMQVADLLHEGKPQIYLGCGRGPRSTLRILQHGLAVEEMADNELPGKPRFVWTVKKSNEDLHDGYIIVSFPESTLILAIGETVEEVNDSNFCTDISTIYVGLLIDDSFVQVHAGGFRHIQKKGQITEWQVPTGKRIVMASSNGKQMVLAVSGGDILCFEVDESHTVTEIMRKSMGHEVTCLCVQPLSEGRLRSNFVAVGGLDSSVRILSLDRLRGLRQLAVQALPGNAVPESTAIIQLQGLGASETGAALVLMVGLETGILLRASLDPLAGTLSDQSARFIGERGVRLASVTLGTGPSRAPAGLALSSKPWLCYSSQGKISCVPLHYDTLEAASSFASEQCPDGFVAISGRTLRIFQCVRLGEVFSQSVIPLTYTPRQLAFVPPPLPPLPGHHINGSCGPSESSSCMIAVVEADHNAYDEATKVDIQSALKNIQLEDASGAPQTNDAGPDLSEEQIGTFKAGPGKWGSCIRIINPSVVSTLQKVSLDMDEAAFSCIVCQFLEFDSPCIVVGTAVSVHLNPRKVATASIKVYAYDAQFNLTFLHSTPVEEVPKALCAWNGRLLAGVGNVLRIYALGKKKLLKKCEYRNIPNPIVLLRIVGDRIFAGDLREGFHVLKYRERDNILHVLADETGPTWLTAGQTMDYHTVIGGDKFDSLVVSRVPEEAKADETADATGLKLKGDTAYLTGQCHKFERLNHFHVGSTVMALHKTTLCPGGAEVILYATIMGAIGVLLPITSKQELDLVQHLEMVLRTERAPLCGRDHLMFRSYYFPVKGVVDGDLCEEFSSLPPEKQREVASELDKTPREVLKKLEDVRIRIM